MGFKEFFKDLFEYLASPKMAFLSFTGNEFVGFAHTHHVAFLGWGLVLVALSTMFLSEFVINALEFAQRRGRGDHAEKDGRKTDV